MWNNPYPLFWQKWNLRVLRSDCAVLFYIKNLSIHRFGIQGGSEINPLRIPQDNCTWSGLHIYNNNSITTNNSSIPIKPPSLP